ncbi:serine/threonine protein kinase [Paenibacillus thiaminolyticus]|uniref:protein kinase domain-containing protein n=1 Tax=Paenibacillus thiaminolyticus TaxID=49283 RepID=UPI0035A72222
MTTSCNMENEQHHAQAAALRVEAGTVLQGVWNGRVYRIERRLGRGANGVVYLVTHLPSAAQTRGGRTAAYALKMGMNSVDFQSEINALRTWDKGRQAEAGRTGRHHARPFLVDNDDCDLHGKRIPFYVMRYVPGVSLRKFIYKHGPDWYGVVGGRLLEKLRQLHRQGLVFGDLKAENVLVNDNGEVELIDYGGLTSTGKSVKQFTELYDRGYWHAGSRTADFRYDLFSFAVMTVQMMAERELRERIKATLPQTRDIKDLIDIARNHPRMRPYEPWLAPALRGEFASPEEASRMWHEQTRKLHRSGKPLNRPTPLWLKWFFAVSVLLLAVSIAFWAWGFD